MKCPFRTKLVRELEKAGNTYLVKSENIEYPDCYEEECPFFDSISTMSGCKRTEYCEEEY